MGPALENFLARGHVFSLFRTNTFLCGTCTKCDPPILLHFFPSGFTGKMLRFPADRVADSPPPHLFLQPPVVPEECRNKLSLQIYVDLARQLEFGRTRKQQQSIRSLIKKYIPAARVPLVKVPAHVFGGHSSWAACIDLIVHYFQMGSDDQEVGGYFL